ncbi:tetraacyldisaccharide 4'-kinase [Fulvimarina sp. 2208YS6-2-32]|uniref:Tetraacyldisaccharide 4'-kinase n=1 Tax=Fulvimarina uroteuthidis TaxID=3098149 RepID=A0ABU5I1V1_9HYPH|nr:tetraacyldisaccharide 4'-kinase [Fulvimarina sp. 2208YS6-2-32]MDY8109339.1 tetraacyldisaccharide 4'-kinase [Fulvimarina sp. 2208YS6-2-32]
MKVAFKAPDFWWQAPSWQAAALSPLALTYGAVAARNLDKGRRAPLSVPVLCVGNPTVGGAGKTPTAMALARAAIALGRTPGFVTRGYRRKGSAILVVDGDRHTASQTGDEPLLLAKIAPTAVSADRRKAAERLIDEYGCDLIIMDDGFQSARLRTDYALLAVDARRGLGNWQVFPSGPLRAPLKTQLAHASAILMIGTGEAGAAVVSEAARSNHPVFRAHLLAENGQRFQGMPVLGFAGIGHPQKFTETLKACGARVEMTRAFPDHHAYRPQDLARLSQEAWKNGLQLVTTAKDAARLATGTEAARLFLAECEVLDVTLSFENAGAASAIVKETLANFHRRRFGA